MADSFTIKNSNIKPAEELVDRVHQLRLEERLGRKNSDRGGRSSQLPWILCFLLAISWLFIGIRAYRTVPRDRDDSPAPAQSSSTSASSNAAAPTVEAGTIQLEVKGYLTPARQIAVSPIDVGGQLIELNIVEGQLIAANYVIARIDPGQYQAGFDEAVASVAAADKRLISAQEKLKEQLPASVRKVEVEQIEAQIREAEAAKARAADEFKRLQAMRTASGRELDQADTDHQAAIAHLEKLRTDLVILKEGPRKEKITGAEADVKAAEADMKAAEARVKQAKWRLDNCVIRAPITGTILSKKSENGNLVNPLAFGGTSGSICDMADLADLEVDIEIPERDIAKVKRGQACRIKSDAYPDKPYQGVLDRIMPIANRSKSIVNVRVKVKLPEHEVPGTYLKPEMGAVVSFLADKPAEKK